MKQRTKTGFCKSLPKRWSLSIFLILVLALILSGHTYAAPIPGLFNTGVNDTGQVLPVGDFEIHYSMTGPLSPAIVAIPNPIWVMAPENSAWIGPTSGFVTDPLGDYTYTLTFDLTGLDPTTAFISGEWANDNTTVIILNGNNTGLQINNLQTLSPFEVSDGFISEINTLQFVVTNIQGRGGLNPTGLLVANLDGQASPVPLPVGHLDYCRDFGPCAEGEGDCDSDSECESGLTCVQVPGTDTCQRICDIPVGHLDYCKDCGPCAEGQGDCDSDSECQGDLTCVQVPGVDTCVDSVCPPVGHLDYCKDCGPCAEDEGDCDSDSECESGLTCAQVPGVDTCQKDCTLPLGHLDYCRECGPCAAGQGDCDGDSECTSGLNCVQVPGTDVCCPHPIGHLDYCRDCGPCRSGQGDCDNDSECQSGLTCVQVPGADTCQ